MKPRWIHALILLNAINNYAWGKEEIALILLCMGIWGIFISCMCIAFRQASWWWIRLLKCCCIRHGKIVHLCTELILTSGQAHICTKPRSYRWLWLYKRSIRKSIHSTIWQSRNIHSQQAICETHWSDSAPNTHHAYETVCSCCDHSSGVDELQWQPCCSQHISSSPH